MTKHEYLGHIAFVRSMLKSKSYDDLEEVIDLVFEELVSKDNPKVKSSAKITKKTGGK